ncbi:MAG: OadG family protein [Magnetococcales bacterium]|nr:OadG family protein [Magnetococcales bacterium]
MPVSELIVSGFELMILGMGTVFAFLALLVVIVGQMSKFSQWVESKLPQPPTARPAPAVQGQEHLAVIAAAVHRYRTRNN